MASYQLRNESPNPDWLPATPTSESSQTGLSRARRGKAKSSTLEIAASPRYSSGTMERAPSRDQFSSLPSEILSMIFEEVRLLNLYSIDPVPTFRTPISKDLRQHTDAILFRDVELSTPAALALFLAEIKRRKSIVGVYVRSLTIKIAGDPGTNGGDPAFSSAFESLTNLRKLHIEGHPRFARVVLTVKALPKRLPLLEELTLVGVYRPTALALDPRVYGQLGKGYQSLKSLRLALVAPLPHVTKEFDPPKVDTSIVVAPKFTGIETLDLTGPLSSAHVNTLQLITSVPCCHSLTLTDTSPHPSLSFLLDSLSRFIPLGYTLTSLGVAYTSPAPLPSTLLQTISRFTALTSLSLGPNTFHTSQSLFPLSALPRLKTLIFPLGTQIALGPVWQLLSGPTRLASLRELRLDVVDGAFAGGRGKAVVLPKWSEDMSPQRTRWFLEAAKQEGRVRVSGTVRWALAVQDFVEGRKVDMDELLEL